MSAVIEGKPCVPSRQPSETISYTPFFGKYATTGRSEGAFGENGAGEFGNRAHRTAPRSPNNRRVERHAHRAPAPRPAPPPPRQPPPPPATPPSTPPAQPGVGKTGGAGA